MTTPQEPGARLVDLDELNAGLERPRVLDRVEPDSINLTQEPGPPGTGVVSVGHVLPDAPPTAPPPEEELVAMAPTSASAEDSGRVVSESIAFATGGYVKPANEEEAAELRRRFEEASRSGGIAVVAPVEVSVPADRPVQGYCARCGQATLVLPVGANRIRCTYEVCPDRDTSARVLDRGQQALSFLNLTPTPVDATRHARGVQGDGAVLVEELPAEDPSVTANRLIDRASGGPIYRWTCPRCGVGHESRTPEMQCSGRPGAMHRPEHADPDLAVEA